MTEADGVRTWRSGSRTSTPGLRGSGASSGSSRRRPTTTGRRRDGGPGLPTAKSVDFEDRDAAYERLRKRCQGKGDLSTQLQPQMTHESWRFEMPLTAEGSEWRELMRPRRRRRRTPGPLAML